MKAIPVSAYGEYSYCPRSLYLSLRLRLEKDASPERARELLGAAVRKELNLRQPRMLEGLSSPDALEDALISVLETLLADFPRKCKDLAAYDAAILQKCAFDLRPELLGEIEVMRDRLAYMIDSAGIDGVIRRIEPWKTELFVKSESLGLSGRIDKVMKEKKTYYPADIKTREYPGSPWEEDRIQACAYCMLLEESFGGNVKVPYGFLEYVRSQERIPVMNTPKLKEETLMLHDEIVEVLCGDIPDVCSHGNSKKCESCGFAGKCFDI
jgi:CRISPR/Cas system-associated exonuclease Cas4 (RecB family)